MTARTSPWGGVELLERAIGYTRGCLGLVTPALMREPTPCGDWDLEALLVHMADSLESLHEAGAVRRVWVDVSADEPVELVETIRARACILLADWSVQGSQRGDVLVEGRPVTAPVLTSAGALEVAVHGWDLATACGVHRPLPDALATDLLRVAPLLVTGADRPARFAPALDPPAEASAGERLLAFLGRRTR
jgi:uncharacterized protein (TIGR03086 family)